MFINSFILFNDDVGSFFYSFIPQTLKKYNSKLLIIFSGDEMKQLKMGRNI